MRSLSSTPMLSLNTCIFVFLYHYVLVCYGQHYVNIALSKTCWQSSTYSSYIASKAVDNNTSTFSHTNDGLREYWEVDLGHDYHIKDIRIYPQPRLNSRLAPTTITVDSRVCARVPENRNTVVNVSCENFEYGRRVKITKDANAADRYLTIGEFQIWVCQQGYYGETCNKRCLNSYCLNNECDRLSGECRACNGNYKAPECNVCQQGYYGETCNKRCLNSYCLNNECDRLSGECRDCNGNYKAPECNVCQQGYYGQTCNKRCLNSYCLNNECDRLSGQCRACNGNYKAPKCNECKENWFGQYCQFSCTWKCYNNIPCNVTTGFCHKCPPGFQGQHCDQACDRGKYGVDCMYDCGSCANSQDCDKINGSCLKCVPGKKLPNCELACDRGKYGEDCKYDCGSCADYRDCDKINGSCQKCVPGKKLPYCISSCDPGYYGENCIKKCGHCLNDEPCNATGHCKQCKPGFQMPLCQEDCESKTFGQDCLEKCGECADNAVCHAVTGHCPSCKPGLQPHLCKDACKNGTYGSDCSKTCGHCKDGQPCNVIHGECIDGCTPGWTNKTCDQAVLTDGGHSGATIGGVIAIFIIIVVIAIIAFIVIKKRRLQQKTDYATVADIPIQDTTRTTCEKNTVAFSSKPRAEVKPQIIGDTTQGAIYENAPEPAHERPRQIKNEHIKNDNRERQQNVVSTSKQSPLATNEITLGVMGNMGKPKRSNENVCKIASKEGMTDGEEDREVEDEYEEEFDDSVYSNDATNSKFEPISIPVCSLQMHLLETLNSSNVEMEFVKLPPKMIHSHDNGLRAENYNKNRFNSILPYDSTRVVLDRVQNDIASDYINASYIKGHRAKIYIAAQGPKNNTVNDFWRMVWQERVQHIVMLTNVLENTKPKCHEYWPAEGVKLMYGQIEVRGLDEQKRAHYVNRAFEVKNVGSQEKRRVEQFHYVSWFDHDVPRAIDLVDFWRFVKSQASRNSSLPLLVHCSAGVGRSGTYIALDIIMDHAEHEKDVNIFGIVRRMRDERCSMVQNKKQYAFLHEVVLEAYTSMHTRLNSSLFNKAFSGTINSRSDNDRIDKEYEKLKQMQVSLPKSTYTAATQEDNRSKNRNQNVLPADKHLVFLAPYVKGRNQYINAVYVSTFVDPRGCILTQLPVPDTLMDIWRLIDGCGSTLVVSIKNLHDKEEEACRYWPSNEGETINNGIYTLTMKSKVQLGTNLVTYCVVLHNQEKTREVRILTYTAWDQEIPSNTPELLHMIETLQSHAKKENNPVVIQCKDGAAKSGLLCALWEIISRMNHTYDIDVYLTVRKVQSVRRQAINSVVQYRYCFEVVQQYSNTANVYANA